MNGSLNVLISTTITLQQQNIKNGEFDFYRIEDNKKLISIEITL